MAGLWMLLSLVLFVAAAVCTGLLYALVRHSPVVGGVSPVLWPAAFLLILLLAALLAGRSYSRGKAGADGAGVEEAHGEGRRARLGYVIGA